MLSEPHKFIYLHPPKTGGNSLQAVLLAHSSDQMVVLPYQDGKERFEIRGNLTPTKHATLADYYDRIEVGIKDYKIIISIREPAERAISAYFSPARWMRKRNDGSWFLENACWNAAAFVNYLKSGTLLPMVSFLCLGSEMVAPNYIVRYERYVEDVRRLTTSLGLNIGEIPHLNRSAAAQRWRATALGDRAIRREIEEYFRADYEFFHYKLAQLKP